MIIQSCQADNTNICPNNILNIDKSECLGNSLERVNDNFNSLKNSLCTATSALSSFEHDLMFMLPIGSIIRYWGDIILDGVNFDASGRGRVLAVRDENLYSWALCNGNNGTPDLQDRFIVSTGVDGGDYDINYPAGNRGPIFNDTQSLKFKSVQLIVPEIPEHKHIIIDPGHDHKTNEQTGENTGHQHGYNDIWEIKLDADPPVASGNALLIILPILLLVPVPPIIIPLSLFADNVAGFKLKTVKRQTIKDAVSGKTNLFITDDAYTDMDETEDTGNDVPHENRPPYTALGFIMRIS